MSLREPRLKMSKSHQDSRSRIDINDDPELIHQKIKIALTDSITGVSFDPQNRPGVSNLLAIMSYFDPQNRSAEKLAQVYETANMREFKIDAADMISDSLASIREKYNRLISADSRKYLDEVSKQGALKARALAGRTMSTIKQAMGLS